MPVYNPVKPALPPEETKSYSIRKVLLLGISAVLIVSSGIFLYLAFKPSSSSKESPSNLQAETNLKSPGGSKAEEQKSPSPSSKSGKTYRVEAGDTLFLIGQKFGVDWHAIAAANNLKEPYTIKVGQELIIPENVK